jgi:hypothetical protein
MDLKALSLVVTLQKLADLSDGLLPGLPSRIHMKLYHFSEGLLPGLPTIHMLCHRLRSRTTPTKSSTFMPTAYTHFMEYILHISGLDAVLRAGT